MSDFLVRVGPVTPTPPGPTQLAAPSFSVTPTSSGTQNDVAWSAVANAYQYQIQKASLEHGAAAPGDSDYTADDQTFADSVLSWPDGGLTLGRDRYYRMRTIAPPGSTLYSTSDWAVIGPIYTAAPAGISMPTVAKAVMSVLANLPALGGLESEFGFTTAAPQIILDVNNVSTTKQNPGTSTSSTTGFTARVPYTRYFYCNEADALEISDNTVIALGGNSSTGINVVYSMSGLVAFNRDLTIRRAKMNVLMHTAPSPGRAHRRTNLRIAADDVCVWHRLGIQGNIGSSPGVDNSDGIQIGASSFTGTPIQRSGAYKCTNVGATDESGEIYSAGDKLFMVKCTAPWPLRYGKSASEKHNCGWIAGEIPTQCSFIYTVTGNCDFRSPALVRAPLVAIIGGFSANSSSQWLNINPNNRANGGFGANQQQHTLMRGHGFLKGQDGSNEELVQIKEYISGGPTNMVSGSSLCLKDNFSAGFSAAVNDADQLSYVREYNGGPFGSGTKTTGLNATYYTTTPQAQIAFSTYTPVTSPTSLAEWREYVILMSQVCGARNADRGTWNYDRQFFECCINEIDLLLGNSMTYPSSGRLRAVDTLSDIPGSTGTNGYPSFANNTRDLMAGSHPIPTDWDALIEVSPSKFITKLARYGIEEDAAVSQLPEPSLVN